MKGVAMGSAPSRNFGHFLTFCAEFVGFVVLMAGLLSATILAFALGAH